MLKFSVIVFFQLSSFCNSKIDIYCCKFFSLLWPPMMFFTPTCRAHAHSKKNKIYTQTFKGDGECSSDSVLQNMLSQWTKPTAVYNYRFTALCVCDHGCVCVFGRCLTFLFFFFWLHLTSIYLPLASKCSVTLQVPTRTHAHTETPTYTVLAFANMCTSLHILSSSHIIISTHAHTPSHPEFFIWIIHYYIRAALKSRENWRQWKRRSVKVSFCVLLELVY